MAQLRQPDIVSLIKHVCLSLQSYAAGKQVEIFFTTSERQIAFDHQPLKIIHTLSHILCTVISYLPAPNKILVHTSVVNINGLKSLQVSIYNTGINMSKVKEITNNVKMPVTVTATGAKGTTFIIQLPIPQTDQESKANRPVNVSVKDLPVFYEEVRKRLQSYFSRTNSYLENLNEINPKKAAFLKKINECVLQNLHNENFDATALSNGMAMSRTQLFRKLKPVISQSPASYIKGMRLQKAKELLETSELSVSEVAHKTGFKTPSHFTKVFTEKFGIRPSAISKFKAHVTNE